MFVFSCAKQKKGNTKGRKKERKTNGLNLTKPIVSHVYMFSAKYHSIWFGRLHTFFLLFFSISILLFFFVRFALYCRRFRLHLYFLCLLWDSVSTREGSHTNTHTANQNSSNKTLSENNFMSEFISILFSLQRFFLFSSSVNNDGYCNICCNLHSFSFIMLGNVVCIYKCSIYLQQLAVRIVNASWNGFVWALFRVEKKSFGFAVVAAIFFVSNRNFFAGRRCCFRMNRTTFMLLMV